VSQYSYKATQYESLSNDSLTNGNCSTDSENALEVVSHPIVPGEDVTLYKQQTERLLGVIEKMSEQNKASYDLRGAKFGGGFAAEGAVQAGGAFIDFSVSSNLTDAAQQIQDLLQQLNSGGMGYDDATSQAAKEIVKQAESNPALMGQLVQWGKSLADTASKTTVSEAAKVVVKLALQMAGVSIL
jgi:hypothetical protein